MAHRLLYSSGLERQQGREMAVVRDGLGAGALERGLWRTAYLRTWPVAHRLH